MVYTSALPFVLTSSDVCFVKSHCMEHAILSLQLYKTVRFFASGDFETVLLSYSYI
jgi:hypothetical protein